MSIKNNPTYFQEKWLTQDDYWQWLVEAPVNTSAKCKLCKKTFKLSTMAEDALKSHAGSMRHIKT